MKKFLLIFILSVNILFSKTLIIATGEETGNYYKIGQELNTNLYQNKAKILKTSGSVENMLLVAKGKADIALVQEDALSMLDIFFKAEGLNKYDLVDMAGYLYTERLHILVNQKSNIQTIKDLHNKVISYGSKKSGSSVTASFVEQQYNIDFKKVIDTSIDESLKLLSTNKLDAVFYVTKSPSNLLSKYDNLRLLESKKVIKDNPDIKIKTLSKKSYSFLNDNIKTYAVKTIIITKKGSQELAKVQKYLQQQGKQVIDNKKIQKNVLLTGKTLLLPQKSLDLYVQKYGNRALFRYNYIDKYLDKIKQQSKVSQQFQSINLLVNKIHFLDDRNHWKKEDYWSSPLEFIGTGIGDSEEFALFKLLLLSKLGLDSNKFKLIEIKKPLQVGNQSYNQNIALAYFYKKNKPPIIFDYKDNNSKIFLYKNNFAYTTIETTENKNWNKLLSSQLSQKELDKIFAYIQ